MQIDHLRGAETLVRNSHLLMTDAMGQARDGKDTVLEHRLGVLANAIMAELAAIQANIEASQLRRAV